MKNNFFCNSLHNFNFFLFLGKIYLTRIISCSISAKGKAALYMNLEKLYEFQRKLDKGMQDRLDVQGKALLTSKLLALQVKIGELANETQCFKFWVSKKSPMRRKILEKYIDCLYLTFSIGIEKGFTETEFEIKEIECELTEQFLNIFIDMNDFMVCSSKDHYITLIEDLLSLSTIFDFAEDDILNNNNKVYSA
jgi:dimeric dUTPase (all-alpha-NTP-PPase superfamily)